jgi:hypothetical protein
MDKHDVVAALKRLHSEMGKVPKRSEFIASKCISNPAKQLDILFNGSFRDLLLAAGLDMATRIETSKKISEEQRLLRKYKALCSRREQIQSFFRHVLNLDELFERAGNPEVLKFSAMPDTHAKFRDEKAYRCYLKFLSYYKPHGHIILGDFADCEGLSHWEESSLEPRRIVPEMKLVREMLGEIVEATPVCSTRIFLKGNHEDWIDQALTRMPELFDGLAELDIEISAKSLMALEKFGYQMFPLNELVQIGKAHFTHGWFTGSDHAKKHLKELACNLYYGHLHDMFESNDTNIHGPVEAASLGCLCRLDAKFLKGKKNNWVHGHGTFEFFRDGTYFFNKHRIFEGKMSYNGIVFEG